MSDHFPEVSAPPKDIIVKLRQADALISRDQKVAEARRMIRTSEVSGYQCPSTSVHGDWSITSLLRNMEMAHRFHFSRLRPR